MAHLVVVALPLWGHTRPLCVFIAKLQQQSRCLVTFFVAELLLAKVTAEIARQYAPADAALLASIRSALPLPSPSPSHSAPKPKPLLTRSARIISILDAQRDNGDLPKVIAAYAPAYAAPYAALVAQQPLTCTTGRVHAAAPPPSAVILDFLAPAQLQATRAVTGSAVPVFAWVTGSAPVIIRYYCPEDVGGLGDVAGRARAAAAATGKEYERMIEAEYGRCEGEVICIPGMPAMFDYECFPQDVSSTTCLRWRELMQSSCPSPSRSSTPWRASSSSEPHPPTPSPPRDACSPVPARTLNDSDGTIINTSEAYESVFIETLRGWLSGMGKAFFSVGPTTPADFRASGDLDRTDDQGEIAAFLDGALEQYGKESVIFISFGSTFWPKDEAFVEEILNVMIEKEFPFIFAYGSPAAKLPNIKSSPKGLLAKWVPQQYVLNHPALGWFLTHCGQGSTTEALASGIPMICYPFASDQPFNAAYLSMTLDVAFELLQVRTGVPGTKPALRTLKAPQSTRAAVREEIAGVVDAARGAAGRRKRANAQRVRGLLAGAWAAGALAAVDLQRFAEAYCS
ncbi:hypothetical protein HWV62_29172 [Athelia sp. TMB]|nr:hypothetical protein HWV62_29172 [Athelia sp. TMB]